MATIPSNQNFPKAQQTPDNSILDKYNRQTYLGNSFIVTIPNISLGDTTEHAELLIKNPSTSTKSLFIDMRRGSSSLQQVLLSYYVAPTVTVAGTPVTPVNLRPANANTSVATVTSAPTASAEGTNISNLGLPSNFYVISDTDTLIILDPGQSMLVTAQALTATTIVNIEVSWYEI